MALEVKIQVKEEVTSAINDIEKRFNELQRKTKDAGKSIDSDLSSSLSRAKEVGESYLAQLDYVQKLKVQLRELAAVRDSVKRKGNAATEEDAQAMYKANTAIKGINKTLKEENEELEDLKDSFNKAFKSAEKDIKSAEKSISDTEEKAKGLKDVLNNAAKSAAALFTVDKAVDFGKKVLEVRGEMQALEASFSAMLGSKENARKMISEAVDFAATTPFDLQSVASSAKQLLAYGTAQENVLSDMKMLGDVAAGLDIPLSNLIYLYGTLRAQGRVMTIDIRQFAMRGIPIYDELAKVLGVAKDEVASFISSGNVTFETVEQAFKNMTAEGGKFHGLMDGVFNTVNGKISNIGDGIYQMLNDIGQKTDGLMMTLLNGASWAVDHYKEIGKVVGDVVIVFGSYKAAVIAVDVVQKIQARNAIAAAAAESAAAQGVTRAYLRRMKVLQALTKLHLTNPYVLAGAAVGGLAVALFRSAKAADTGAAGIKRFNEATAKLKERAEDVRSVLDRLDTLTEESDRSDFVKELIRIYPQLIDKYTEEELKLMSIKKLKEEIAALTTAEEQENSQKIINRVDKLREAIARDEEFIRNPGLGAEGVPAVIKVLTANKKELELLEKEYADILTIGPRRSQMVRSRLEDDEEQVKNKAYWEKQQKSAKGKLERMSIEQMNSAEGAKQLQLYNEASEALEKYSFKKVESKLEKARKEQTANTQKFNDASSKLVDQINEKIDNIKTAPDTEGMDSGTAAYVKDLMKIRDEANKTADSIEKLKMNIENATDPEEKRRMQESYDNLVLLNGEYTLLQLAEAEKKRASDFAKLLEENLGVAGELAKLEREYKSTSMALVDGMTDANQDDVTRALENLTNKFKEKRSSILQSVGQAGGDGLSRYVSDLSARLVTLQTELRNLGEQGVLTLDEISDRQDEIKAYEDRINNLAGKSIPALAVELASLMTEFDILTLEGLLTPEEAAEFKTRIEALSNLISNTNDETDETKQKWTDLYTVVNQIGDTISEIGNKIGGNFGLVLTQFGSITKGLGGLINSASGIKDAKGFAEIFTGSMGVVSGTLQLMSSINSIIDESWENTRRLTEAAREYESALSDIEWQQRKNAYSTAFGSDDFGAFLANYQRVQSGYNDVKKRWENETRQLMQMLYGQDFADKIPISVGTGKLSSDQRTGWQKFWGTGKDNIITEEWSSFFDENGNLLGEKLKAWYEQYGEGLSNSNKRLVEDLLSEWETYEEALAEMGQYMKGLFGDVQSSIADDMYESFISTGNALSDLTDYAQNFQKNIAKSVIQSVYLSKIFSEANQEKLTEMLGTGDTQGAIDLFNSLIEQSAQVAPDVQKFLEGLNLNLSNAQQTATAGGFQTMSQDTGTELNGRFATLQLISFDIRTYVRAISGYMESYRLDNGKQIIALDDIRQIQANALLELMAINDNTSAVVKPIKEMNATVLKINEKVSKL